MVERADVVVLPFSAKVFEMLKAANGRDEDAEVRHSFPLFVGPTPSSDGPGSPG